MEGERVLPRDQLRQRAQARVTWTQKWNVPNAIMASTCHARSVEAGVLFSNRPLYKASGR